MQHPKKKIEPVIHQRVNYEAHSQKFLDWVDSLGLEKTFVGRFLQNAEEKYSIRRSAFVFIYCVLLSYVIFFEFRIPYELSVGQVASHDITAPMDFEMIDEVTTEEKRQKAEVGVPSIFDYDPTVSEKVSLAVSHSFKVMRLLIKEQHWPKSVIEYQKKVKDFLSYKSQFETDVGINVSDSFFEWLVENKFNKTIEQTLLRTLKKWYENKIADGPDKFISLSQTEIIVRAISKSSQGKEIVINKSEIYDVQMPEIFDLVLPKKHTIFSENEQARLIFFARQLLMPNLTFNKQETISRRQSSRSTVLPINLSIKKGQMIIKQGTVVQPIHMAVVKHIENLKSDRRKDLMAISLAVLLLLSSIVFVSFGSRLSVNRFQIESKDLMVMMTVSLVVVVAIKIFLYITDQAFISKFSKIPSEMFLFMTPVAAAPMLVGLLISSAEVIWIFVSFMALAFGIMMDFNFVYAMLAFIGGVSAARGVCHCKKRNDIYMAGLRVGIVNALLIVFLLSIINLDEQGLDYKIVLSALGGFIGGIFSSLITMMLVPLLESLFGITTDVKLLELSNLNHPLLKEMIVNAPGTYHHSMMVGSMVEAAAEEIGANSLLGKVMCYYHDIGKLKHPKYFIENQKSGQNPHDHISPFMSKTLLVAHVKDGVELGVSYQLGKSIIDGIVQHHGTTLISYFYNKAVSLRKEDEPEIHEEDFRYPGPKPQFREAALCMLADSIEAAARSLDEPTPIRLHNIVKNVIQRKYNDGQLDECNLTLKDLTLVESAFSKILLGIYHQRIDYPRSAGGRLGE